MELVKEMKDIIKNAATIENYLMGSIDDEYAMNLIKLGTCFVVILNNGECTFYPSRFMGYKNNNKDDHQNNEIRNGGKTNDAISTILGPLEHDDIFEREYIKYCEKLGFTANLSGSFGIERKYWKPLKRKSGVMYE